MKKEILSWIGCFVVAVLAALFIVTFDGGHTSGQRQSDL